MSRGFLKPNIDDDVFKEDKVDIDTQKNTSFIFNPVPSWSLNAQRTRLPIAKNKNDILYLLEQNQVLVIVGDTGCGKSTIINQLFNRTVSATAATAGPVTQELEFFHGDLITSEEGSKQITIIDTIGKYIF